MPVRDLWFTARTKQFIRFRRRFGTVETTFRGMIDAGVIEAGPAVLGHIEEAK
jgi:hypothetical protein